MEDIGMSNVDTQFKPGHAKIPGSGRPKNSKDKYSVASLKEAFDKAEVKVGMSIYDWLALEAYKNPQLAIALLKKTIPDMKQVEVIKKYEGGYSDLTPAEACEEMDKATLGDKPNVES